MSILSKPISDPAKKVGLKTTIFKSTNKKLEAYLAAYEERWGKCDKNLIVDALLNFAIEKDTEFKETNRRKKQSAKLKPVRGTQGSK